MFVIYSKIKLILVAVLFFPLVPSALASPESPPVAKVVWVKGNTLKAVMPNKEERILKKASPIYVQDVLITDNKTTAEIVFSDNTLMTFRKNTKFSIDQYTYDPKQKTEEKKSVGKYLMSLIEGGFRTITGLIAKNNPADYQVNTPVATIGVRGTDYAVYLRNNQVYIGYYQGSPCVTNKGKQLCLDSETPYAFVSSGEAVPVPLSQQPDVFKQKLDITPATMSSLDLSPAGGIQQPAGDSTTTNSFCIS